MNFKRYNSLINSYKAVEIIRFIEKFPQLKDEKYIIAEKLHGCLDSDTIIDTLEFGKISIEKIVENKLNCHVKTFDLELNEIIYEPITNWFINENNSEWYLIELEDGTKIKITENHPVYLPELKCFRQVKDLKENDYILFDE
jgi:intein/homing endonuclease